MGQLYAIIDSSFLILLMNGESSSNKYLSVGLISKLLIKTRKCSVYGELNGGGT